VKGGDLSQEELGTPKFVGRSYWILLNAKNLEGLDHDFMEKKAAGSRRTFFDLGGEELGAPKLL
jgi:hypothetical protein